METVKLKDVKLANAVRVDVEDTRFTSVNYEITLEDRFFIRIRHKVKGNENETTVYNMISMHREPETEVVSVKASDAVKANGVKKRVFKSQEAAQ